MKFNFKHLIIVLVLETAYFYLMKFGYAIHSMLFYGEGANSFMYSKTNEIIYYCLLIIPQTVLNIIMAKKNWNNSREKSMSYMIAQILVLLLFGIFYLESS